MGIIITIFKSNTYYIGSQSFNKSIIVNVSCTIFITASTFMNNNSSLTPFIIEENKQVDIQLRDKTTIIDSPFHENNAIIYLKKGARVTIENYYKGSGLILIPNSLYAIKGEELSTLSINNCDVKIISMSNISGGIFIKSLLFFENHSTFYYKSFSGNMPAIECEGPIWFANGKFDIISLKGSGIKSKNKIVFGEMERDKENLIINISSLYQGIEAAGIDIFSATINIESKRNGIIIDDNQDLICYSNCSSYIKLYDGFLNINSNGGIYSNGDIFIAGGILIVIGTSYENKQFIYHKGILSIDGGVFLACNNNSNSQTNVVTTQKEEKYIHHLNNSSNLGIYYNNKEMVNIKIKNDIEYIYYTSPNNNYILKFDGYEKIFHSEIRELLSDSEQPFITSTILNSNDKEDIIPDINESNSEKQIDIIVENNEQNSSDGMNTNNSSDGINVNNTIKVEFDNNKEDDKNYSHSIGIPLISFLFLFLL